MKTHTMQFLVRSGLIVASICLIMAAISVMLAPIPIGSYVLPSGELLYSHLDYLMMREYIAIALLIAGLVVLICLRFINRITLIQTAVR